MSMRGFLALYGLLLGTILLLTPLSWVNGAEPSPTLTVREDGVGLYPRQDVEAAPIARLKKGEDLDPIIEAVGRETWYMVRTPQGEVGWVRGADVVTGHTIEDAFKELAGEGSIWSARTSDGRIFRGRWSAAPGPSKNQASGGWTLSNSSGVTVARGAWSAERHSTGWNGVWHANIEGREGELTGSWSADLPYVRNEPFTAMFDAAAQSILHGLWTGANRSGTWSIRYVKPHPRPASRQ